MTLKVGKLCLELEGKKCFSYAKACVGIVIYLSRFISSPSFSFAKSEDSEIAAFKKDADDIRLLSVQQIRAIKSEKSYCHSSCLSVSSRRYMESGWNVSKCLHQAIRQPILSKYSNCFRLVPHQNHILLGL